MAAPVTKDQELELEVESLAYGGNGVARTDGFVVFVRRGLPGDTVRARVTKVKRSHAEALATEVLVPGPARVEAPCAHYPAWRGRPLPGPAPPGAGRGRGSVRALPGVRRLPLPGPRLRGAGRGEGGPGARGAAPHRRVR